MTKLRKKHKELEKKVKKERKIVAITTLWEVVREFRSCDEKMQNQWVKGVTKKNGIER